MVGQLINGENFPIVGEEHGIKDRGSTSTYDQICDDFLLILPHLSISISMKVGTFFRRYIHDPSVRGNIDEISSPRVITIKIV